MANPGTTSCRLWPGISGLWLLPETSNSLTYMYQVFSTTRLIFCPGSLMLITGIRNCVYLLMTLGGQYIMTGIHLICISNFRRTCSIAGLQSSPSHLYSPTPTHPGCIQCQISSLFGLRHVVQSTPRRSGHSTGIPGETGRKRQQGAFIDQLCGCS